MNRLIFLCLAHATICNRACQGEGIEIASATATNNALTEGEFNAGRSLIGQGNHEDDLNRRRLFASEAEENSINAGGKEDKLVTGHAAQTWPQGKPIPYRIDEKFGEEERLAIAAGMLGITDNTCVEFEPLPDDQLGASDYINITTGAVNSCSAFQGYSKGSGSHIINLLQEPWCSQVGILPPSVR